MKTALNSVKMFLIPCVLILAFSPFVGSHCQVPCGIYNDQMRIDMISEHITTIEKSISMINELSAEKPMNTNQVVRWVNNKELHSDELIEIVTYYFMSQRTTPVGKDASGDYDMYVAHLTSLHRIMVLGMKAKQEADLAVIPQLRKELEVFSKLYLDPEKQTHAHKH